MLSKMKRKDPRRSLSCPYCSYYVGFIFRDVGVRLEIAGIIIQVMLSTQEISRADPLLAVDCHSRIPADSSPSVEV